MFKQKKTNPVDQVIMAQVEDVKKCLVHFEDFMRAACTENCDRETLKSLSVSVCNAESDADLSLRRMIDSLYGASFLPSTRTELIDIASSCDKVANKCEFFVKKMISQHFRIPQSYAADFLKITEISSKQFDVLESAISQLFSNYNSFVKDHSILDEIRNLESQVDEIEEGLYDRTYSPDTDLATSIQTERFIEIVSDISDIIENIADKLQIMLVSRKA